MWRCKIRGFEGDKCHLYTEILDVSGSYTEAARELLLGDGKIEAEINQLEQTMNGAISTAIGYSGICRFSVYSLKGYLTEIKNGNYELSAEDIQDYECTGNLYEN